MGINVNKAQEQRAKEKILRQSGTMTIGEQRNKGIGKQNA